ncbi:MAG: hydroxymethylbilane synthase [Muricauda sp.]|nr:hydroxymethylbilane synthase [Allomuricauda sp.]MBO6532243.1 hydroxymethylbilane synthase [Allomuricauda sp.]MBO6588088.1 hydroxymethylbilane synthase [Allomuricauda sp.]MBO6617713.1 hydroxymethylbilane synthase [Allomuricauda sp.]MBO6643276.1 hydroxymethylbilane synthase [Allomuricauda sp.]MBO6746048.1 hydroxymethylbilane synthase [Allomuricauda sp.]
MSKIIRIGTRDSELALWQATTVQQKLEALGYDTILVPTKSMGDQVLDKPLYELGVTGIFTKTLDVAMLKGDIDIAVHSMKDVPTQLPNGIVQVAVLERAITHDILVHKGSSFLEQDQPATIATGSLRRKAQWLNKYPHHTVVDLRGNVNTRLLKLIENDWQGAIFAQAGLERIKLLPKDAIQLDWMIPAPAQGAMLVVAMEKDAFTKEAVSQLNHTETELSTTIEREFLRTLEGGCTAPIGALAQIKDRKVYFEGVVFSLDGKQKIDIKKEVKLSDAQGLGKRSAEDVLQKGGDKLMQEIRNENNTVH